MERGQTPKILHLAPNSVFVPFPSPFFSYILSLSFYGSKDLGVTRLHTRDALILKHVRSLYLGASYTEAYYNYLPGIMSTTYVSLFHMYLFITIICIDMT